MNNFTLSYWQDSVLYRASNLDMKRNLEPFNINKLISWFTSIVHKTEGELNNKLLKMKCSNGKFIYMKERLFTHCSKFKHFSPWPPLHELVDNFAVEEFFGGNCPTARSTKKCFVPDLERLIGRRELNLSTQTRN